MFHRVKVTDEDSKAFRLFYWKNGDHKKQIDTYQMTRHIFGATDSPCTCVYAL